MSALLSQARNRGQARVHVVQPFSPWMQLSGPSSSSRWNGLHVPLWWRESMTSCGHVSTHPAQPVHRPLVMTSSYSSFHCAVHRWALAGGTSVTVMGPPSWNELYVCHTAS